VREPEFVPSWYPLLLRRRRLLAVQSWATAALTVGLAVWALVGMHRISMSRAGLAGVQTQLTQTGIDLQRLNELSVIQAQLERQDQIVRDLGVHVPVARMLSALSELMPPMMALTDLELQTEETATPPTDADRAKGINSKITRKLRLKLTGVAPTEDELATFLTQLYAVPYFSDVGLVKSEEQSDKVHLMRQFQVKFALDLDRDPGASGPGGIAGTPAEGATAP
jgi:Tfp pilus assembly protein PilN